MTEKTFEFYGRVVNDTLLNYFSPGKTVKIGNIHVTPFLKSHDAVEPCSFSVSFGNKNAASDAGHRHSINDNMARNY